jgi:signal transduction histidine kinase
MEDTNKAILFAKLSSEYMWRYADTGRAFAEEGLQLSKKLNYKYGEAICSINLCVCLLQEGDFTNALDFGFKALTIFQRIRDIRNTILSYGVLMICYRDQGDYKQALEQGYKAKEIGHLSRNDSVNILGNISSVYEKSDNLDSALFYGLKVYQLNEQYTPQLITLGNIYSKMGKLETALNYYKKGLKSAARWSLMDLSLGLSKVYELNGKIDSSVYNAQKSFSLGKEIGNPRGTLEASKQLAHLYELIGKPDSVVKYLKLSVTLNDSLFSNQKTREAQSFAFNVKLHQQELTAQQQQNESTMRTYILFAVIIISFLIAFFLLRSNMHKQKANNALQEQKQKVESTLTKLKSTQAQLIQSEKMASLGELTAGIAHEIQNPLNFVNNFSEVNTELIDELQKELKAGNAEDAFSISTDIKENEQKILQHGKRADSIVKGMLQHSRVSASQKEAIDMNALADEYLRLSYHVMRAKDKDFNATLQTDFDESIGKINVVPQDIGRVLLNLYNNAFYATQVRAKQSGAEYQPLVTVTTKKTSGNMFGANSSPSGAEGLIISVRDNGNGIPQKVIDKIFQPFFTTKPTGQGTGLGLSLSYDIIKAHGGEIRVESKAGEGSEFIINLPIFTT